MRHACVGLLWFFERAWVRGCVFFWLEQSLPTPHPQTREIGNHRNKTRGRGEKRDSQVSLVRSRVRFLKNLLVKTINLLNSYVGWCAIQLASTDSPYIHMGNETEKSNVCFLLYVTLLLCFCQNTLLKTI